MSVWIQWKWSDLLWYDNDFQHINYDVMTTHNIAIEWHCMSLDINECTIGTDNCHTNAICTNTVGSFYCTCQPGYAGNGVTCACKALSFVVGPN